MRKWPALLCSCLALGLVAAGCGGDDEDEGGGDGAARTEERQPAPAGGGKTTEVTMKDIQFDPESISVAKGTTVRWTNEDSVGHDVTKTGGAGVEFKSGEPGGITRGKSYERTFDTAGTVEYVCTVHPGMTGEITVK
jgi:plastocyanin